MHPMIVPLWQEAVDMAASPTLPACLKSTALPLCYSPQQIRQAYGVQPLLDVGITGKGRTITLIELAQEPTIEKDLHTFDRLFGLPDPQLKVFAPFGKTPAKPDNQPDVETALDVEWAHVMAPDATIEIIPMKEASNQTVLQAMQFAVQQNSGDIISMSFGGSEQCLGAEFIRQAHTIFQQARAQKQTVLASAGDSGSADVQCDAKGNGVTLTQIVSYPASDPLITSVGGTALLAGKTGTYQSETAWDEAQLGRGATGGGFSNAFAKPDFQQHLPGEGRGVSDLSFDADPLTGVPVVISSPGSGKTQIMPVGGTSLGAPAIAGMAALFDQAKGARLGFLNNALYRINENADAYALAFRDIRLGNNPFVFKDDKNSKVIFVPGFDAATGWDPPTGVGTPYATKLALILPLFVRPNDGSAL
jgi:subtilase family serine protease